MEDCHTNDGDYSKGLSVLLLQDHRDSLQDLTEWLRREGHHVVTATSSADAQAMGGALQFDVLMCDARPSRRDGELLSHLAEKYPIVGFTLGEDVAPDEIKASLQAGFKAHLSRPLSPIKLHALLKSVGEHRPLPS